MKNRIVFLSVNEDFPQQLFAEDDKIFTINPDIPIPVEIPAVDGSAGKIDIANLSMEMILSGLLRVIEEGEVEQEWTDYYCSFVFFLRPDILSMVNEMSDDGLGDENYINAYDLVKEGNAEEGLPLIRDFLETYPRVWNGWFVLGWALRLLGRWQDARAALEKAIQLGGDYSNTRNELAICLMETEDYAGAKRELETALKTDDENIKLISNLGVLALKTGNKNEAAEWFRKALEIDPEDPVAKSFNREAPM